MRQLNKMLMFFAMANIAWIPNVSGKVQSSELKDRSEDMMRLLSLVDASDRNFKNWWTDFTTIFDGYNARVDADSTLYCSNWQVLKQEMTTLAEKIQLVQEGLTAKVLQLSQIRDILDKVTFGEDTGLHCNENPNEVSKPICDALDALDKAAAEDQVQLDVEKKRVQDEIAKVESYICDCTYEAFINNFSDCSTTCGPGIQTESVQIKWEARNGGSICIASEDTQSQECELTCCVEDCEVSDWDEWTPICPEVCGDTKQTRHRQVVAHPQCNGNTCPVLFQEQVCPDPLGVKNQELKVCQAALVEATEMKTDLNGKLCNPNPCLHGGDCLPDTTHHRTCKCTPGYTGTFCEIAPAIGHFQDAGCYEDTGANRLLTGKHTDNIENNRPKQCRLFCGSEFKYYGVESTNQCFCGNTLNHLNKKPESECDQLCPADSTRKCGGFDRLNLYRTSPAYVVTTLWDSINNSKGKYFGLEEVTMPEMGTAFGNKLANLPELAPNSPYRMHKITGHVVDHDGKFKWCGPISIFEGGDDCLHGICGRRYERTGSKKAANSQWAVGDKITLIDTGTDARCK